MKHLLSSERGGRFGWVFRKLVVVVLTLVLVLELLLLKPWCSLCLPRQHPECQDSQIDFYTLLAALVTSVMGNK